jgi:lysophospholipase L1-like esterase
MLKFFKKVLYLIARYFDHQSHWKYSFSGFCLFFLTFYIYYCFSVDLSTALKNTIKNSYFQLLFFIFNLIWLPKLALIITGFSSKSHFNTFKNFVAFCIVFVIIGELLLRILFFGGVSFGNAKGIIHQNFHKNVMLNKYDGPSRGPEIDTEKRPDSYRILVQGDSITWGQGVKIETDLYTSVLLKMLRKDLPKVEMAVLAKGGREIEGHLDQLIKYAPEIYPDIIIYQWHITDIEFDKRADRPKKIQIPWNNLFFTWKLRKSYLWFMLTFKIESLLPQPELSYSQYIKKEYEGDTEKWKIFSDNFSRWYGIAKSYTSKIIILIPTSGGSLEVEQKFIELAQSLGAHIVNTGKLTNAYPCSQFDKHPNRKGHFQMAKSLYNKIKEL